MEFDDLQNLPGAGTNAEEGSSVEPTYPPGAIAPSAVNELVADLLETTGLVSPDRLAGVRSAAVGGSVAQAIVDEGLAAPGVDTPPPSPIGARGLRQVASDHSHLPQIDLNAEGVDKNAASQIPTHVLERAVAIPYKLEDDRLFVAVADPTNVQAVDELRIATRYTLEIGVAPTEDIEVELKRVVRATEAWERAALVEDELDEENALEDADDLEADDGVSDAPLVRLVNSIILQAAEDGASDLHFDPQDDSLVVRLRVDGVLHEVQRIPKRLAPGVTTRLKVLAKLDIAERRKPQDGRISLNAKAAGRMLDIRVAVLPTVEGEGVVMRLLDKSKRPPTLAELGLSDEMRAMFAEIIQKPTGALLVGETELFEGRWALRLVEETHDDALALDGR